jgi:hypothetical protein
MQSLNSFVASGKEACYLVGVLRGGDGEGIYFWLIWVCWLICLLLCFFPVGISINSQKLLTESISRVRKSV